MAKAYQEGNGWSVRPQIGGERLYLSGFATKTKAQEEAKRLASEAAKTGSPKHDGPHRTSVAKALLQCALERLPYLKSAPQEARRINRFLRAGGLPELQLTPLTTADTPAVRTGQLFDVKVDRAAAPGVIPMGLHAHRARVASKTADSDMRRVRLAHRKVAYVTRHEMQEFINALRSDGLSASTIALEHAVLRSLFNYTHNCWHWTSPSENPATGLKMPQIDNARDRVMSEEEQTRLDAALAECRNGMVAPMLTLLRETAMRSSEPLERACWGDVDWARNVLSLRDAKGGKRDVPLSPDAIAALQELLDHQATSLPNVSEAMRRAAVAPNSPIVQMTYEALKAAWKRACERAGVKDLHLHDLRHTSATRMALKTGNVFLVKALTGHRTMSQVQRYVNVKADDVVKVMHAGQDRVAPNVNKLVDDGPGLAFLEWALAPSDESNDVYVRFGDAWRDE
jgi:site-specific recombinase XerD